MPRNPTTLVLRILNQILLSTEIPNPERRIIVSLKDEFYFLVNIENRSLPEKTYFKRRFTELIEVMIDLEPVFLSLEHNFNTPTSKLRSTIKSLSVIKKKHPLSTGI